LKNDLSVWDDRRGSYNLLFSPPKHIISLKKEFPLCPPPSWKKEKKNVLVKTIVKYIYPHYTRYSLSTQRQARQTQIQRHTPFTVGFDVDKFKASSPRSTRVYGPIGWNFISSIVFFFAGEKWSENVVKVIIVKREKKLRSMQTSHNLLYRFTSRESPRALHTISRVTSGYR
jgi:hypothetical protein